MRATVIALASLALAPLAGCGINCQSACQRIYNPSECGIRVPGQDWEDSAQACQKRCDDALDTPGDLDGYDPLSANTSGATVSLDNEKQAAYWMECVFDKACQDLDDGFCAPI